MAIVASARSSEPTLSPFLEAREWADELEQWAFVKERVLSRLDIRAAKKARALAADLRGAMTAVEKARLGKDEMGTAAGLERVANLRREAVELVSADGEAPTPATSMSGSRKRAEVLAPISQKARWNRPDPLEPLSLLGRCVVNPGKDDD